MLSAVWFAIYLTALEQTKNGCLGIITTEKMHIYAHVREREREERACTRVSILLPPVRLSSLFKPCL